MIGLQKNIQDATIVHYANVKNVKKTKVKGYYDLFYFTYSYEDIEFCFHLTYEEGLSFLESNKTYKHIKQKENKGNFRFGRTITEQEIEENPLEKVLLNYNRLKQILIK